MTRVSPENIYGSIRNVEYFFFSCTCGVYPKDFSFLINTHCHSENVMKVGHEFSFHSDTKRQQKHYKRLALNRTSQCFVHYVVFTYVDQNSHYHTERSVEEECGDFSVLR